MFEQEGLHENPELRFEWDREKDAANRVKHGVAFGIAQEAFSDPLRVVARDEKHDLPDERRFFCIGKVNGLVLTVRFTLRRGGVRIFGAAEWRKGRRLYEQENSL